MKIYNIILFILFVIQISIVASDSESLMSEANVLYKNKKFEEAAKIYEQIIESGDISAALYYNLGNAYFREGKLGKAILNYERALMLDPGDEDINYNLNLARAKTVDKINEVPQIFLVRWWELLITSVRISTWATITSILFVLFLIAIALYFTAGKVKIRRFAFFTGVPVFIILLFSATLLFASYDRAHSFEAGVLLEQTVSVKSSPDEESGDVFVIHEGIKFKILDRLDNWVKIKLADGKVGWLPKASFELI